MAKVIAGKSDATVAWLKKHLNIDVNKTPVMCIDLHIAANEIVTAKVTYEVTDDMLEGLEVTVNE